jgi:hypothetical protein
MSAYVGVRDSLARFCRSCSVYVFFLCFLMQVLSLMDGAKDTRACVMLVGTCSTSSGGGGGGGGGANSIDMALRRPGRLDREGMRRMLAYAGVCWRTRSGACMAARARRMLTFAHACSRMLTYAHVCSRMLSGACVAARARPRGNATPFSTRARRGGKRSRSGEGGGGRGGGARRDCRCCRRKEARVCGSGCVCALSGAADEWARWRHA